MDQINKVKSISIWIFIIPFVAINTCLILVTQFHEIFPNRGFCFLVGKQESMSDGHQITDFLSPDGLLV